jgi:hypothetical protein
LLALLAVLGLELPFGCICLVVSCVEIIFLRS